MKHHTATAHRRIVKLGPDSTLPLSPAMLAGLIHAKTATVGNCYRNWYGPLSDWYGRPPARLGPHLQGHPTRSGSIKKRLQDARTLTEKESLEPRRQ